MVRHTQWVDWELYLIAPWDGVWFCADLLLKSPSDVFMEVLAERIQILDCEGLIITGNNIYKSSI